MSRSPFYFAWLWLLTMALSACGHPAWQPKTTPACFASTGDLTLDRERTYLAALLALSERGYSLIYAQSPEQIEVEYTSEYKPEKTPTRWLLTVQPDASLVIDTPPNHRETHGKTSSWYQKLEKSIRQLQCRELNWLRWEAQNRGLVAVGMPAPSIAPSAAQEATAGGDSPASQATLDAPAATLDWPRIRSLEQERAALRLPRHIAWGAVGAGLAVGGLVMVQQGLVYRTEDCSDAREPCVGPEVATAFMITGAAIHVTGGVILAVVLPRLFPRLRTSQRLNREIKLLRKPQLSMAAGANAFSLTMGGTF